ncbi:uncharacterized protein LOC122144820 [Cyprinus carpio]|uniref:Gypsy retrotransposon integrase-like protein 1 n=1 Tax=Cyprinus carpio TaxID=7962 RepID=A0A9Q9Y1I7_CYPCA|nr:uncharacterized protein LOC122144820 [Cyprinus carpio]
MPPKKQDKARAVEEVEPPDQSEAEEVSSEGMSDSVAGMLQTFLQRQQQREDRMEKEVQRQEHKWRTLQHQFIQLQAELRQQEQDRLSMEGVTVATSLPAAMASPSSACVSRQPPHINQVDDLTSAPAHEVATQATGFTQPCFQSPRMLPWTNDEDIEHYLTTFERIAQACRWPKQDWALHLLPLLTGKARAAYVAMDSDDAINYDDVKQAILDKFEINNETYRQRFRSYSAQEDETPRELQVRLKDLYEKWMTPKHRTKEEIGDQIVLEQFLKLLSLDTRTWVKQNNPTSSRQAAEMAEAFMAARQSLNQPRRWRNYSISPTGKSGDGLSSGLTNSNLSSYVPHVNLGTDTNKHQGVVNRYKGKAVIVCHACGQPRHKKVDCPVQKVSNTRLCYVPRPLLEFSDLELNKDTVIEVKIGNKFYKALVDSGSSQTLVRTECLIEFDISSQSKLRVRCIHGDEREYPKTDLVIEIDNQAYNLSVGVVEQAPYPVILGRDVPVLVDLLQTDRALAEARVVTRAQAKYDGTCKQSLKDLPFDVHPKVRKSRRDRRQRKVEGTKMVEKLPKPSTDEIEHISHDIVQLQRPDKTLKSLFEKAENMTSSLMVQKDHFVIRDDRLYVRGAEGERLVVPEPIRLKMLQLGHSVPWAGHLGQQKTLARIASRFYWPRLYMDVMDFCRSCPECQLVSPAKKGDRAPLVSLPIIDVPFSRIAMDIVGPLQRSSTGNRYILVGADYATRYPEAFPLKKIKTRQIVNALIQLFSRVGIPKEIITDQGTNFTSKQIKQVYSMLRIHPIQTTPYHPQTDGMVERFNQTLKSMLRKFVSETGADWDHWLPYLMFAYREVPQVSTGYSPFELLYGRQVRGPLDVLKEAWEADNGSEHINILSYVIKMREKMDSMVEMVRSNMTNAQQQQKQWYDQSSRSRTLSPGQKVLLLLPTSDSSLLAKWQGPYEVVRKLSSTSYEILLPDRRKKYQVFHINLLRPWHERKGSWSEQLWARKVDEEEEVEEQYFPVDKEVPTFPAVDHLTTKQQIEFQKRVPEGLFSDKPGKTKLLQHNISLLKTEPIRQTHCRVPARLLPALKNEVKVMLDLGIIEPSRSEWCSPVVLVPKKDGTLRFCVDFSKLNAVSAFDPYPMPRVDELIERLGKAKYLTTLDLCKGYWQVPLTESAKELTAFRVPSGLSHFRFMPFGLHGAAATFQRLVDQVLRGMDSFAAAYIDDIVIFSATWEEHFGHLAEVFDRVKRAGLVVNAKKCQIAKPEVTYLGYVLGGGSIRPQVDKVQAILSCVPPTTKKSVRSFLGLSGWYRRFVPNFASRAAVLTDLTRKSSPIRVKWTPECEQAFQDLKFCLCKSPVLQSPDFDLPFIVQTDASEIGLGAVLLQGEGPDRHPVQYISRKLFPREANYSTIEKEALAIKWALDTLKYYILLEKTLFWRLIIELCNGLTK